MTRSLCDTLLTHSYSTLRLTAEDSALLITIDRPSALNALSPEVIDELRQVFGTLRDGLQPSDDPDWSVRGVVLIGAGEKAFVAGADISRMAEMSAEEAQAFAERADELTEWIETLPVPVVAAVNGFALGGGCELALACDVIYASSTAAFGQPEVLLGLIPGFGGTVRLQRAIGAWRARDLILTGRRVDANEAAQIGLVQSVFPDRDALLAAATQFVERSARNSPLAVAAAKRTIRRTGAGTVSDGLRTEAAAFAECFTTHDMREGTRAFLEKRTPDFLGRP